MLGQKNVREIAAEYAGKVVENFSPDKVVLFGSYVNGIPNEYSDIDIAVVINNFSGDWLETSSELYGLAWDFDEIIEPHLLDETQDPLGFTEHVINTGEVIYRNE